MIFFLTTQMPEEKNFATSSAEMGVWGIAHRISEVNVKFVLKE